MSLTCSGLNAASAASLREDRSLVALSGVIDDRMSSGIATICSGLIAASVNGSSELSNFCAASGLSSDRASSGNASICAAVKPPRASELKDVRMSRNSVGLITWKTRGAIFANCVVFISASASGVKFVNNWSDVMIVPPTRIMSPSNWLAFRSNAVNWNTAESASPESPVFAAWNAR